MQIENNIVYYACERILRVSDVHGFTLDQLRLIDFKIVHVIGETREF